MDARRVIAFIQIFSLSLLFFLLSVIFLKGFSLDSIADLNTDEVARKNIFNIALILCAWLFIPLLATVIISLLAFRISPDEESVEAEGENVIKVLPGLKFRAKGATATFIILIALSSPVVLPKINSLIIPSQIDQYVYRMNDILHKYSLVDESNKVSDINAGINYIDNYLEKVEKGLDSWKLNTKLGIYNPKTEGSTLMSDTEIKQITKIKDSVKVNIESIPKVEPSGTNVWIEKLLYFPIGIKNVDDVKKAIEDEDDDINLVFEVRKPGDNTVYKQSVNLKTLSLNKKLHYEESKENEGKARSCDINQGDIEQSGLTLSINFEEHRTWIGPCIFLDYRSG